MLRDIEKINNLSNIEKLNCIIDDLSHNQELIKQKTIDVDNKICNVSKLKTTNKECIVKSLNELYRRIGDITLVDNKDGTYTYTSSFKVVVIDTRADSNPVDPIPELGGSTVQEVLENISKRIIEIEKCLEELKKVVMVDNGDGTYTYTNIDGSKVTWNNNPNVVNVIDELEINLESAKFEPIVTSPPLEPDGELRYLLGYVKVPKDGIYLIKSQVDVSGFFSKGFLQHANTNTSGEVSPGLLITNVNIFDLTPWITGGRDQEGILAPQRNGISNLPFSKYRLKVNLDIRRLSKDQYVYLVGRVRREDGVPVVFKNPKISIEGILSGL